MYPEVIERGGRSGGNRASPSESARGRPLATCHLTAGRCGPATRSDLRIYNISSMSIYIIYIWLGRRSRMGFRSVASTRRPSSGVPPVVPPTRDWRRATEPTGSTDVLPILWSVARIRVHCGSAAIGPGTEVGRPAGGRRARDGFVQGGVAVLHHPFPHCSRTECDSTGRRIHILILIKWRN